MLCILLVFSTYDQVGERCHVFLLDLYISKMPKQVKEKDYFYLRPLESSPRNPWYYASPVGEHKLGKMVKEMFSEVGVSGKTNHSLRATGASALFQANVAEKIIQERTGHRSVKALGLYERTTEQQHHQVSSILCNRMQPKQVSWQNQQQCTSSMTSPTAPAFGMLQNCTINVNYGPSTVNIQHQAPSYDNFSFPEEVEKELSYIDL